MANLLLSTLHDRIAQTFRAIMEEVELDDIEEAIEHIRDQLYPLKTTPEEIREVIQPYFGRK